MYTKTTVLLVAAALAITPSYSYAASKKPSSYDPAVPEAANLTDFPRDFAHAMYKSASARLVFGQAQSVVEPLYYMAETDPEQADIQNFLAVAIYFGQTFRRQRAHYYSQRAYQLDPKNDVYHIVYIFTDPSQTIMEHDGNLVLTTAAAKSLSMIVKRLKHGNANHKMLAEILGGIQRENQNPDYPYYFAGFDRLLTNPSLLITRPAPAAFTALEYKIEQRLMALREQTLAAKKQSELASEWFSKLQSDIASASGEERVVLERKFQTKKNDADRWMKVYDEKLIAMNEEFTRLEAFLSGDFKTLASLRIQKDTKYEAAYLDKKQTETIASGGDNAPISVRHNQNFGDYYALVIGNNSYHTLQSLKTAVNDANAVAETLEKNYDFRVKKLLNISRAELIGALYKLRGELSEKDNLLIYYAGHGYFDENSDRGYWLTVDADIDNPSNWVSNSDITDQIRAIKAKHILVVADSCYSGTLTRGIIIRPPDFDYLNKILSLRTRLVITSGGNEPVADSGSAGHSVFANAFISALQSNSGILESTDMFQRVRKTVVSSPRSIQVPNFGILSDAEHDGGDFVFVRQ